MGEELLAVVVIGVKTRDKPITITIMVFMCPSLFATRSPSAPG